MNFKKITRFIQKNYLIFIFLAAVFFVGLFSSLKMFLREPNYVYVKVKMGQGLWWAQTQRPSIWQVDAIKKGDVSYGAFGKREAEILAKRVYRFFGTDQFDIYLSLKLDVAVDGSGNYTFNRSALLVGSPIDLQFKMADVTGTVIAVSEGPFEEKLVEKTVTLTKKYAYPWEFEAIKVGDSYFDGEDEIFEVVDKQSLPNGVFSLYPGANVSSITEPANYVLVEAKVLLKDVGGQWILGEDQPIVPGRNMSISTPGFVFDNYIVSSVE